MGNLGKDYFELGRGYEKISKHYSRPYVLGVNINHKEKPFIVAMGDHHSDIGAIKLSVDELVSGKFDEHIKFSNSDNFIENLYLNC